MPKSEMNSKIMLIVGGSPVVLHSGNIYINEISKNLPIDSLCRVSLLTNKEEKALLLDPGEHNIVTYIHCNMCYRASRLVGKSAVTLGYMINTVLNTRYIINQCKKIAKDNNVSKIWVVLDRPQVVDIARKLAMSLDLPLVVTIWDPPEKYAFHLKLGWLAKKLLMKRFESCLKYATKIAVVSKQMANEYYLEYKVQSTLFPQPIDDEMRHKDERIADSKEFVIGYAGTLYANKEFDSLLKALDTINWKMGKRKIIIKVLSSRFTVRAKQSVNIQYYGWRTLKQTINLLSECDINYLPYWFSLDFKRTVMLSFPSKLSAYLASNRPLFIHAPCYASTVKFNEEYSVGLSCCSLESKDILQALTLLSNDSKKYNELTHNTVKAFSEVIDQKKLSEEFMKFMELS